MASSEVLSETLHAVTRIKLDQLDKQKNTYETAKRALLDSASHETGSKKRARLLIDGAEKLPTMTSLKHNPTISLDNFRRFVEQAEKDRSVSEAFLSSYQKTMRNELDVQSNKYAFATLYGQLVNEWISVGKAAQIEADSGFVPVGREEMHKQRTTWEDYVFNAKETDQTAIKAYLEKLFVTDTSKEVQQSFKLFRERIQYFQKHWDERSTYFTEHDVAMCIKSLLRSDVINDKKRSILNQFLDDSAVREEIADVLNMRMTARSSFAWEGVSTIEQRRQLNGRYRFYPDEDLLQTIFLQYIGLSWAAELRRDLENFTFCPGVMKSAAKGFPKQELRRRTYFLGKPDKKAKSVESERAKHWKSEIFLDQLPFNMHEVRESYGEDKSEGEEDDTRSSPMAVVQKLLHILQTEIIMQTRFGEEVTVIRSDFKWFGPSVPHNSIFAVLEFFGVNEDWIEFFKKVLEAPITFKDDAAGSKPQNRKRGTPIGVPLAVFFGEAMLYCADFAVNQKAGCARLYRLHDDIWLWGELESCTQGWSALT